MRLPKDILYILHDQGVMTLYHFVKSGYWGRPGGCTLDWEADTFRLYDIVHVHSYALKEVVCIRAHHRKFSLPFRILPRQIMIVSM